MNYEVLGQDDMSLDVGAPNDKTLVITLTGGNHLRIRNDSDQPIIYSMIDLPAPIPPPTHPIFPGEWNRLDPKEETLFPVLTWTKLYLRKKVYYRAIAYGQEGSDLEDVTANVEVNEVNIS